MKKSRTKKKRELINPSLDKKDYEIDSMIEELQSGLQIDKNDLDDELQKQPELFYKVSDMLALQISRRDAAKQWLQEVEAIIDNRIRQEARDRQDRLTEREIDSLKQQNSKVRSASNLLLTLNRSVGRLTALKEAFQQRGYVIKDLSQLYIANYYSDVSVSSGTRKILDHDAQHAKAVLKEKRRKAKV